jgi:putative redox protein
MIEAKSEKPNYSTRFYDGTHEAVADTTTDKGGSGSGFRPHDLLEAALACCINMSVRMYAEHHGIPLAGVTTRVKLDRSVPEEAAFRYELELQGDLTAEQKERLSMAPRGCPVSRTLSRTIRIEQGLGETSAQTLSR